MATCATIRSTMPIKTNSTMTKIATKTECNGDRDESLEFPKSVFHSFPIHPALKVRDLGMTLSHLPSPNMFNTQFAQVCTWSGSTVISRGPFNCQRESHLHLDDNPHGVCTSAHTRLQDVSVLSPTCLEPKPYLLALHYGRLRSHFTSSRDTARPRVDS